MSLLGEIERTPVVEDRGVLRFITAGSVDDGKSTLIGRLLHDTRAIFEDQLAAVTRASSKRGQDDLEVVAVVLLDLVLVVPRYGKTEDSHGTAEPSGR